MNDIEQSTHREDFQIDWIESHDIGLDSDEDCEENVKMRMYRQSNCPRTNPKKNRTKGPASGVIHWLMI